MWCDGRKVSLLDTGAYEIAGKLVMLGAAGLLPTLPGTGAAAANGAQKKAAQLEQQ